MANEITTDNINTKAQEVASIGDGDFVYIFKTGAQGFSRITIDHLLQNINGSSGGIDATTYNAIKTNVDLVNSNVNSLINALANLAFKNGVTIPSALSLEWPDGSGTDPDPVIPEPTLSSPASGTTINIGTIASDGVSVSKSIYVKGSSLTKQLNVSVSGTGFSVSPLTVSASNANSGTYVIVTYNGSSTTLVTGTLTISSDEVSQSVSITAKKAEQGVTYHSVHLSSSSVGVTLNGGGNDVVANRETWTGSISANSGYTLPQSISVTMNGISVSATYNNGSITIANVTGDILIEAIATPEQVEPVTTEDYTHDGKPLILHMSGSDDGAFVTENGFTYWKESGVANNPRRFLLEGDASVEYSNNNPIGVRFASAGDSASYGVAKSNNNGGSDGGEPVSGALRHIVNGSGKKPFIEDTGEYIAATIEVCFTPINSNFHSGSERRALFVTCENSMIAAIYNSSVSAWYFGTFGSTDSSHNNITKRELPENATFPNGELVTVSQNASFLKQFVNNSAYTNSGSRSANKLGYDKSAAMRIGGMVQWGASGTTVATGNQYFANAIIHEVRIYAGVLTEAEASANRALDIQKYGGQ